MVAATTIPGNLIANAAVPLNACHNRAAISAWLSPQTGSSLAIQSSPFHYSSRFLAVDMYYNSKICSDPTTFFSWWYPVI